MHIAFLADPLDRQYGGIHVYTKELLKALSTLDKKNEYSIIRSESKNEFEGIKEIVVPYYTFPGYRSWRLFYQVPKILKKRKVDVVVEPAHFGPFNLPKSIKRITVIHDMTVFLYPEFHVFLSQFFQRKFLPRILKNADHIVTNSANTTRDVVRRFPFAKGKISSFLLGKDQSFQPKTEVDFLKRYKLGLPYILSVGTLEPRKNIPILIAAFDKFKDQSNQPHKLVLIGKKGWKSDTIFEAMRTSRYKDEIMWLGYIEKEELPLFYSNAEVTVYPSLYEGFGLPILEAMACGSPVISSNASSLPEVGGDAVMYFSPDSTADLTKQLITLCSNHEIRTSLSQKSLSQASRFSWDNTAMEYIHLFDNLSK